MTIDELFAELDKKGNSATCIIKDLFDKKYIYLKSKDGKIVEDKWPEDADEMRVIYSYKYLSNTYYKFVVESNRNALSIIEKEDLDGKEGSFDCSSELSGKSGILFIVKITDIKEEVYKKYINYELEFGDYYRICFCRYHEDYFIDDNNPYMLKKSKDELQDWIVRICYKHDYIISGPPGTGKSHFVNNELVASIISGEKEDAVERFLMTNASMHEDLFGAYKPVKCDDKIKYEFVPGPFSRLLNKAYSNPENNYVMIIEELNRGNSSEVLGDLLQLFDRNEMNESKYKISTPEVAKAYFKRNQLYLPNNLFVVCTMNNSDAGVFPISDELRRRFIMSYIDIDGNYYGAEDFAEAYNKVADGKSQTERIIINKSEDYTKWLESEKIPRYYFDKYIKGKKFDAEELVLALLMYKNSHDSKAGYSVKKIFTEKVRKDTEIKLEDIFSTNLD